MSDRMSVKAKLGPFAHCVREMEEGTRAALTTHIYPQLFWVKRDVGLDLFSSYESKGKFANGHLNLLGCVILCVKIYIKLDDYVK